MIEYEGIQINEEAIRMMKIRIINLERKNARSHESKDSEMIKEIMKEIIEKEVATYAD